MRNRPEYNMTVIGKNLRRLREAKKLSVEEVREYLYLGSVQAIYKYEQGKGYPPTDTMFALMELYDASLQDIVGVYEEDRESSSAVCKSKRENIISMETCRDRCKQNAS